MNYSYKLFSTFWENVTYRIDNLLLKMIVNSIRVLLH